MNQPTDILMLVSDPLDAPISIQSDLVALSDALRNLDAAARFNVMAAEADAVQEHLERGDRQRYSVLHYLGHGYRPAQAQDGFLVFEDRGGMANLLDVARLNYTLAGAAAEFKVAVISACHSESVADALFSVGIDFVVAIEGDQTVYEAAAIAFCRRFYQSLLTGNTIDRAFDAGRRAIFVDEAMRGFGDRVAKDEVAKFKLLSRLDAEPAQFRLPIVDGQTEFHDLPTLTDYPFYNQPKEFIGRNEDMRNLLARINGHRAAVILGVSGVGKTELAKQIARRMVARQRVRPERVGFAALANMQSVNEARSEIARALGLAPDDVRDDGALQRMTPRNALVILDEAESVILRDGAAFRQLLEALIGAPSTPIVIVTSQTDPNTLFAPAVQVRRLSEDAAYQLFAVNANLMQEQSQSIDRRDLSELLGYVDRLPRAIELIARVWRHERGANPDNLDLSSVLAQLRVNHDRVMRDPDYPDEIRSVTVGVQYAYDRLRERSPEAADLWSRLSLFPGGVSKAGLAQIFDPDAVDLANKIQAQSLVEVPFGYLPPPFSDLMQLPTPFRLFALRQLPEGSETAARHALGELALRYYYAFDEEPYRGWVEMLDQSIREGGDGIGSFMVRYEAELPSIEAWLDWAYEHESGQTSGSRAAQLTAELTNIYRVKSTIYEKLGRLDRAIACALRGADERGEADVRWALGDLLMRRNDLKGAHEQYDAALALYSKIGQRGGEANALLGLGNVLKAEGDLEGAREKYAAALNIYRDVGHRLGEANALKTLGDLSLREGDPKGAQGRYGSALLIYHSLGDKLGEANTLQSLGSMLNSEGSYEDAIARLREAFIIHAEIGNLHGIGACLAFWAQASNAMGRHDQATLLCEFALEIFRLIPDVSSEASTLVYQGEALLALGLKQQALAAWWQAREIFVRFGNSAKEGLDTILSAYEAEVGSEEFSKFQSCPI